VVFAAQAWRLAGPGMALLMAAMLAVVSAFIWMTVRNPSVGTDSGMSEAFRS